MFKKLKFFVLLVFVFSLTACEEEEILNPRRATDGETPSTSRLFTGAFTHDNESQPACPTGEGASVTIDFSNKTLDLVLPVNNINGEFGSPTLSSVNQAMVNDGPPVIDSMIGSFTAAFLVSDTEEDFDTGECDTSGGGYALSIRITVQGVVSNSSIQNAAYTITNVCNNESTVQICGGQFSGMEPLNNAP